MERPEVFVDSTWTW